MADAMSIGLVGCGKQARKHIAALRSTGRIIDIRVADARTDLLQQLAREEDVTPVERTSELFADPTVNGIMICTPTSSHFELITQALDAGKPTFCEKPLCATRQEAVRLLELSRRTGLFIQVGYVYRHVAAFRACHEILTHPAQPLGRASLALFRIGGRGSHQVWKHKLESDGGAINEMLVHMLDLAIWLFGPLRDFRWYERALLRPQRMIGGQTVEVDAEDLVLAGCRADKCRHLIFQADLLTPAFRQHVEIQGENGSLFGSIQEEIPSYLYLHTPKAVYAAGRTELDVKPCNLFGEQMRSFLRNLEQGVSADSATVDDSVRLFDILAA